MSLRSLKAVGRRRPENAEKRDEKRENWELKQTGERKKPDRVSGSDWNPVGSEGGEEANEPVRVAIMRERRKWSAVLKD